MRCKYAAEAARVLEEMKAGDHADEEEGEEIGDNDPEGREEMSERGKKGVEE